MTDADKTALFELLKELDLNSPMKTEIVDSQKALDAAIERHKADGRRLACVSNTGLKPPFKRVTFLPNSAFTDKA